MDYTQLIQELVEELLNEITFLKAVKNKTIGREEIQTAIKLRNEASKRQGQKIPVLSPRTWTSGGSSATMQGNVERNKKDASLEGAHTRIGGYFDDDYSENPLTLPNKLDRTHMKLSIEKPYITIDVEDTPFTMNKHTTASVVAHELGHILDPVQNDPEQFNLSRRGRDKFPSSRTKEEQQAIVKDEARAWKTGRGLIRDIGLLTPEADETFKKEAAGALRTYTKSNRPEPEKETEDDYNNSDTIREIAENLLDETTLLQAYKRGEIGGNKIKDASRMRKVTSEFHGQKIPVVSNDRIGKRGPEGSTAYVYSEPSPDPHLEVTPHRYFSNFGDGGKPVPTASSEKLHKKFRAIRRDHVVLDTDDYETMEDPRPTLGHELGHIVDVSQRTPEHRTADTVGRSTLHNDAREQIKQERQGIFYPTEPAKEVKKVLKSEGRAWRLGKEIQDIATIPTEMSDQGWKETASSKLRTYTTPYVPYHWSMSAFRRNRPGSF